MKPRYGTAIWAVTHHKRGGATVKYLGIAASKADQLKCGPNSLAVKEKGGGISVVRNWCTTDQIADIVRGDGVVMINNELATTLEEDQQGHFRYMKRLRDAMDSPTAKEVAVAKMRGFSEVEYPAGTFWRGRFQHDYVAVKEYRPETKIEQAWPLLNELYPGMRAYVLREAITEVAGGPYIATLIVDAWLWERGHKTAGGAFAYGTDNTGMNGIAYIKSIYAMPHNWSTHNG